MRRIASDDQIKNALMKSLQNSVKTLSELHRIVSKRLYPYAVSLKRLKLVALKTKEIDIKIKKRVLKSRYVKNCPVCGSEFEKKYGIDVFGKKNHVGYVCKECKFSIGLMLEIPYRYIFSRK
ncbi:MAG: hypothetical protein QXM68_03335 [Candidatus Aenigmatarchaeota archaeon]|nr:hypothetical protein [Candidatus Aenigmarchaeota archaeon]